MAKLAPRETKPRALLVCQAFPPLLKNAGGVSKRYLTLCKALIEDLGWHVVLISPVNVTRSKDKRVDRWLQSGDLTHIPARGISTETLDGNAVFLDLFSHVNAAWLLHALIQHPWHYQVCIADDVPWRLSLVCLMRAFNVPTIITSHTDATRLEQSGDRAFKLAWWVHMASAHFADVHASVSNIFAQILREREKAPVNGIWPVILWSEIFRDEPSLHAEAAQNWREGVLVELGWTPRAVFMYVGRWSSEKRIHLLTRCIPDDCALVICGDGTSEYSNRVMKCRSRNVLPRKRMLNADQLRAAYQGCDLFVSASDFETLGNTVIESLCSGTPVAVQPAQGHLEFVRDGRNSYFVDFEHAQEAKCKLARIVDAGLQGPQLDTVLPEFSALCSSLRASNFAQQFASGILTTALAAGARRRRVGMSQIGLEHLMRFLYFLLWALTWGIMRFFTRTIFFFSTFPKFRVVSMLGSSVEDE